MTGIKLFSFSRCIWHKTLFVFLILVWYFNFHSRFQIPARAPSLYPSHRVDPRVVVGIMANWKEMGARVKASRDTWIAELSYNIFYFVGASETINGTLLKEPNIIELPYDDNEYPPINKTFAMWSYFYENHAMHYDYFVAADTDTYINVKQLERMIQKLKCNDCYVGYPGLGGEPAHRLGIHGPYCYGLGYIISRSTLLQFGPHLDTCRSSIFARHSDTEMGRCIYKYVHNLTCQAAPIPFEAVWFTVNEKNEKIGFKMNERQQMDIDFPQAPPTRFLTAVMVHPLKRAPYFYRFHEQVILHLRPILSPVLTPQSCVSNPVLQQEIYPQEARVPECPTPENNKSMDIQSLETFVITLPGSEQRAQQTIKAFYQHGIHVRRFTAAASMTRSIPTKLSDAQWYLRMIMTDFFHMALRKNLSRVLALEDNAIPHRHFDSRLQQLLLNTRCGNYMLNDHSGGIMMLGATVWEEGWDILDKFNMSQSDLCNNICSKVFGSFAVIYHQATFKTILTWLNTTTDDPFDHVFTHLSRLGHVVRFASPNLVVQDVTHESLIHPYYNNTAHYDLKRRADIHRWTLSDYMFS